MPLAQSGHTVRVHYTGRLADGTVFDSSREREPLEFSLGSGMVIAGFDEGVVGLEVGSSRTIEIPAAKAYGAHRPELLITLDRSVVPADVALAIGQELYLPNGSGRLPATVVEITDQNIILDANHRLAGKDLIFDLELVEIVG